MTTITDNEIRKYLGHNGCECRVRVLPNGQVERYGSRDPFDRSKDFWAFMGWRQDIAREMQRIIDEV